MKKSVQIRVHGKVQGVYFRKYTQQVANSLNVSGFVRNSGDTVYIEASAEEANMDKFIAWCNKGPDSARVDRVDVQEMPSTIFHNFEIRRSE